MAVGSLVTSQPHATEAKGDLSLELRVVEAAFSKGPLGRPATGVARIEVVLDSFRASHDVVLKVERPDGRPLLFNSKPVATGPLAWSDARGGRVNPGARGIVVPARGKIFTRIEVPLEGAGFHEIVVRASAIVGAEEASTEGVVRVPVGVSDIAIEDGSGYANVSLEGGR